jgi:sugar transferase (PEP-CTERM system associated)
MLRLFRHHIPLSSVLQLLFDGVLFFAAMMTAAWTQMGPYGAEIPSYVAPAVIFSVVMTCVGAALGLYQRDETASAGVFIGRALLAVTAGFATAYMAMQMLPAGQGLKGATWLASLYAFIGLLATRRAARWISPLSSPSTRVLVVGTGSDAIEVAHVLRERGAHGSEVVGFYETADSPALTQVPGRIFSRSSGLLELVQRLAIDEVIVAVKEQRGGVLPIRELLESRVRGVRVLDLPGFFERIRGEVPISSLKASWLIYGQGFAQDSVRTLVKRVFDFVSATILLLLALPLMLAAAIAIRLESRGPIIYRQERIGHGGRTFWCLKFRSMRADAEADGVAQWAGRNDERVTRVGRFIRKYRIDELPQLVNVLRGDMSLVGPRPERPCFVDQLKEQIRFYDLRHSVKPGLTGWAQVRYSYGSSVEDATRKLQFDIYYVKNHSLFLDLIILVETVRVVLFGEGAR